MSEAGKRSPEEITAAREAARQRWNTGYPLPPMPETKGVWTSETTAFAQLFTETSNARYKDSYRVGATDEQVSQIEAAAMVLRYAVESKNLELLSLYQRLLFGASKPKHILWALKAFKDSGVEGELTQEYLEAFTAINAAVRGDSVLRLGKDSSGEDFDTVIELAIVCFEDFSKARLETILKLVERGFKRGAEVRSAMDSFHSVELPLLSGAL